MPEEEFYGKNGNYYGTFDLWGKALVDAICMSYDSCQHSVSSLWCVREL